MTKIAFINDTHVGTRKSSKLFIDNAEEFYSKVFFPHLLEHNIKTIYHLGDYYDNRKAVNSYAMLRNKEMFLDKLVEYDIEMYIIRGNHDCYFKNTGYPNNLDVHLYHHSHVTIIQKPTTLVVDDLRIGMVPWIDNSGTRDNEKECIDYIKSNDAHVLCGHFEIDGCLMQPGHTASTNVSPTLFKKYDMVLSGHFHTKSSRYNIEYLGSQLEFTFVDAGDKKYFHVLDTVTRKLTPVHNPYTIHSRIKYDDSKVDYDNFDFSTVENKFVRVDVINKNNTGTFDRFIDTLQQQTIHGYKINTTFDEFRGSSIEDDNVLLENTETLIKSYIDDIDTHLDKHKMVSIVLDLKREAQEQDTA